MRAQAVAACLQAHQCQDARVLLLYPPGLAFIEAFFGCLAASAIAVPAYPPDPRRIERSLDRLVAIVQDCRPRAVMGTQAMVAGLEAASQNIPALKNLNWIATDTIGDHEAATWRRTDTRTDAPAFLQYTSGSTGDPKGVVVTHGNLVSNASMIAGAMGLSATSAGVSWLPMYHDMGLIAKVIVPVYIGGRVTLLSPLAFLERPMRWLEALSHTRARCSSGPNFAYDLCTRQATDDDVAGLDLSAWQVAVSGAEAVRPDTIARFAARFAPAGFQASAIFPAYGLAEATLFVTGKRLHRRPTVITRPAPERNQVACGVPGGLDVRIVGLETRVVVARGDIGEVWVAGDSVAAGYWNRPDESAETFGAHLASGEGPFLRTGDLGYWHEDELVISGRLKDLLILRGRNYYPGDIEQTVEAAHPGVRSSAVAAFAIEHGGEECLALVVEVKSEFRRQATVIIDAIRSSLATEQQLAATRIALVPARAIPRTTSGKIRRRETRDRLLASELRILSEWNAGNASTPSAVSAETTAADWRNAADIERWLRAYLTRTSATSSSDVDSKPPLASFGLDSLGLATLAAACSQAAGRRLPYAMLFETDTLEELAIAIAAIPDDADESAESLIPAASYRVSRAQRRMWLAEHMHPGSARYHVQAGVWLPSPVDERALLSSVAALVERHPMLRTSFVQDEDGELVARVAERCGIDVPVVSLDARDATQANARLRDEARALASAPFDWSSAPMARLRRVVFSDGQEALLAVMPHVVCDGVSLAMLLRELRSLYEAAQADGAARLPHVPTTYAALATRERAWLSGSGSEHEREWWRQELAGYESLRLPELRKIPAIRSTTGGTITFPISSDAGKAVRALARDLNTTAFVTMAAGFAALLQQYCGQTEIVMGTMAAGRVNTDAGQVFGMFVNPVVIRVGLSGDPTFTDAIARVKSSVSRSLAHQRLPYDDVVAVAAGPDRRGLDPLIQASLVMTPMVLAQGAWAPVLETPDGSVPGYAKAELSLQLAEQEDGGYAAALEYSTDRFDEPFVRQLAADFSRLITHAVNSPGQTLSVIRALDEDARRTVLGFAHPPPLAVAPALAVHEWFEAQVERTPESVAISCNQQTLTYRQLDRLANRMAHSLLARGVGSGSIVGVIDERSAGTVVALLGVLKTGAAYLPLDSTDPPSRILAMLADTETRIVIGSAPLDGFQGAVVAVDIDIHDARETYSPPLVRVTSDQLAYVMFTSGSTGAPKGVMVEHGQVVAFFSATSARVPVEAGDAWLAITRLAFDPSILEILWPLTRGMRVVIGPESRQIDEVAACLIAERPTHLTGTPSLFAALLERDDARDALASVNELLVGGETLPPSLARALLEHSHARLWNMYGPTEALVDATGSCLSDPDAPITIGKPLANTMAYVCDASGYLVPIGVEGELYLGGASVARGYWKSPELTAARFIPNPFGPGRVFKTGDRVRWTSDGDLIFLGRVDGQVKIRGFRIELGEVASALTTHDGVTDAYVVACEDAEGRKRLIGYVVGSASLDLTDLRRHVAERVSSHAIPSALVVLDAIPINSNGKVDASALPPPTIQERTYIAPRTDAETLVVSIAESLLRQSPLSVTDHFFERGGDSLLAVQLLQGTEQVTGRHVPMRDFYDHPTLEALAAALTDAGVPEEPEESDERLDAPPATDAAPLIDALAAQIASASDRLHAQLGASPAIDRYACGIHQALAIDSSYRVPLVIAVHMRDRSDDVIQAALSALFEQQGLLRTSIERGENGYEFAERATIPDMRFAVLDATPLAVGARDALRSRLASALETRALADPPVGAFQVHAAIVRFDRRNAEVWMALSQTISDRAAGRILRQVLPLGGTAGAAVARPYKNYLARNRRSLDTALIGRFKESGEFTAFRDASHAAQVRVPLGAASIYSPPWRGTMSMAVDARPMDEALGVTIDALRLILGASPVPLRVLTHRRLDNRAQHFLTLGDFHDSVPVLFEEAADPVSYAAQFARVDRWVRDEGWHVSSFGADAEIRQAVFECPFNLNFIGDLSPDEEVALLGVLAPIAFIAYPVLSYTVGRRLEVVLLHGIPPALDAGVRALRADRGMEWRSL